MSHPPLRELLHNDPDPMSVLRRCGRTFYAASLLLPSGTRRTLAELYTFCRLVDDCADAPPDARHASASELLALIDDQLSSSEPSTKAIARFRALAAEHQIPLEVPTELIAGVRSDLAGVRVQDTGELIRYAYRVASTVGLMMCRVLRVDPSADRFAIDLGIGMQLTNIARDIREDALNDRVYVPATIADHASIIDAAQASATGRWIDASDRDRVLHAASELLAIADTYYESAELGMRYLPIAVRPGIRAAARNYRAIGDVIRHDPEAILHRRVRTSRSMKAKGSLIAVIDAAYDLLAIGRERHDTSLHASLGPLLAGSAAG